MENLFFFVPMEMPFVNLIACIHIKENANLFAKKDVCTWREIKVFEAGMEVSYEHGVCLWSYSQFFVPRLKLQTLKSNQQLSWSLPFENLILLKRKWTNEKKSMRTHRINKKGKRIVRVNLIKILEAIYQLKAILQPNAFAFLMMNVFFFFLTFSHPYTGFFFFLAHVSVSYLYAYTWMTLGFLSSRVLSSSLFFFGISIRKQFISHRACFLCELTYLSFTSLGCHFELLVLVFLLLVNHSKCCWIFNDVFLTFCSIVRFLSFLWIHIFFQWQRLNLSATLLAKKKKIIEERK